MPQLRRQMYGGRVGALVLGFAGLPAARGSGCQVGPGACREHGAAAAVRVLDGRHEDVDLHEPPVAHPQWMRGRARHQPMRAPVGRRAGQSTTPAESTALSARADEADIKKSRNQISNTSTLNHARSSSYVLRSNRNQDIRYQTEAQTRSCFE